MQRVASAPLDRASPGGSAGSAAAMREETGWRIDEGWLSAILLVIMVLSTIWSIHAAGWVEGTQVLFGMALAGIGMGLLIARLPWPVWRTLLAGLLVGSVLAYVVIAELLPTPLQWPAQFGDLARQTSTWLLAGEERTGIAPPVLAITGVAEDAVDFGGRIATWVEIAWAGRSSTDNAIFLLLMSFVAWMLGFIGAWGLFRLNDVVIASLPTGIALVTNVAYTGQAQAPFAIFLISLLLLAVSINLYSLRIRWDRFAVDYPAQLLFDVIVTSFAVICILALFSMLGPRVVNNPLSHAFWRYMGEQWVELENVSNRLFAGVSSPGTSFQTPSGRQALVLSGPINLTQRPIMSVFSEAPHYWRGVTYDLYTGRSWRNSDQVLINKTPKHPVSEPPSQLRKRVRVVFDLEPTRSTLLYAPAEPVALSIRYRKQVPSSKSDPANFSALYARRPALPRQRYAVEAMVVTAGVADLRAASTEYPAWVKDRYLQLPDMPARVRELSVALTRNRPTVYDKAHAIEQFIRRYPYTLNTKETPPDRDAVSYFLFEMKEGYCDYFASAMVVLLRLQGIPARVATGYVAGSFDSETKRFQVLDEDSHSWPEVYFPGIGWVAFEPSGYRPAIVRPDASQVGAGPVDEGFLGDEELDDLLGELGLEDEDLAVDGGFIGAAFARRPRLPNLLPVVLVLVVVAALYYVVRLLRERRMPSRELIQRIYRRMVFLGTFFGRRRRPAETPLEYARALTRGMRDGLEQERYKWLQNVVTVPDEAAQHLAESYVRTQYGQRAPTASERVEVERAWGDLWWHLPLLLLRGPVRVARNGRSLRDGTPPAAVEATPAATNDQAVRVDGDSRS